MDRLVQPGTTNTHLPHIRVNEQVDAEGATQLWIPDRLSYHEDCSYLPTLENSNPCSIRTTCRTLAGEGMIDLLLRIEQGGSGDTGWPCRKVGVGKCVTIRQLDRAQLHRVSDGGAVKRW